MSGNFKAIAVVAHPDDCVIFAKPFIDRMRYKWTICYLTRNRFDARSKEVKKYWESRNVKVIFLGYEDNHRDLETGSLSFNSDRAEKDIISTVSEFDLILTHGKSGEYNHPHHVFVHNTLVHVDKPKVYFSSLNEYNMYCVGEDFDLAEFPLHREVIEQFENVNMGYYLVDEQAHEVIDGNT